VCHSDSINSLTSTMFYSVTRDIFLSASQKGSMAIKHFRQQNKGLSYQRLVAEYRQSSRLNNLQSSCASKCNLSFSRNFCDTKKPTDDSTGVKDNSTKALSVVTSSSKKHSDTNKDQLNEGGLKKTEKNPGAVNKMEHSFDQTHKKNRRQGLTLKGNEEILQTLEMFEMPFKEGNTCYYAVCPKLGKMAMKRLKKENQMYINAFSGEYYTFLAHLSSKCSVSFCDPSMSGVRRPSVRACVRQQFL